MIRKFNYKPSLELLISGISGVCCGMMFMIWERYDVFDLMFLVKAMLAVFGLFGGLKFIREYFRQRASAHIAVSDTFIQLPQYLLKPKQIDFVDIVFVSERDVEDGIIKISSKSGFDEIKRKFMDPADFEELIGILKAHTSK